MKQGSWLGKTFSPWISCDDTPFGFLWACYFGPLHALDFAIPSILYFLLYHVLSSLLKLNIVEFHSHVLGFNQVELEDHLHISYVISQNSLFS